MEGGGTGGSVDAGGVGEGDVEDAPQAATRVRVARSGRRRKRASMPASLANAGLRATEAT